MKQAQCHHIRIRDNNDYDLNVEEFIRSIEAQYKIDFRSLPQWKELLQRLHVNITDCKRKIQDANLRKSLIIRKLFIEYTRPTPFELNDSFARTGKKWEALKMKNRNRAISLKVESEILPSETLGEFDELEEVGETPHPNTQRHSPSLVRSTEVPKTNIRTNLSLPPYVCTNTHKRLSPLGSKESSLSAKYMSSRLENGSQNFEWMRLKPNKSVACSPREIVLKHDILQEQILKFTLTNCSAEHLHIRFKYVTEVVPFVRTKILPETPSILYPGIPVVFKFIFKLMERKKEFTSQLFFKVSRKVYAEEPAEAVCIPIVTQFIKARCVLVSEAVYIPPVYFWHMEYPNYPTGFVKISVNDDFSYHLNIVKRTIDLSKQSETTLSTPTPEETKAPSIVQEVENVESEIDDNNAETNNKPKPARGKGKHGKGEKKGKVAKEEEKEVIDWALIQLTEDMSLIANDIVELALDTFIFENTYLYLEPGSKNKIQVYLSKIEHMGSHNCYYDFELINPFTEEIVLTKTVRIFADVLPHPIKVRPVILDMTNAHTIYGFCQDHFELTNTHKLIPVTVKFKLPNAMKKLFRILPVETVIPALASVVFDVKFCSRDRDAESDDLVYFVIEIIVIGHKSVYRDVSPIIFEIIAPFANEFQKQTHKKYYRDLMTERAKKLV